MAEQMLIDLVRDLDAAAPATDWDSMQALLAAYFEKTMTMAYRRIVLQDAPHVLGIKV